MLNNGMTSPWGTMFDERMAGTSAEESPYGTPAQSDEELKEMALRVVRDDIEAGKKGTDAMSAFRSQMYSLYRAKPVDGNETEKDGGRSRIVSSDVMDTVEWMMPSFMKAFAGGKDSINVEPQGSEDIEKAEKNKKLLNWQFTNRCKGFLVLYELIKAALVYGTSYAKVTWREDFVRKGFHLPEVIEPQMEALMQDQSIEEITAGEVEEIPQVMPPGIDPNSMGYGWPPPQIEMMRVYRDVRGERRIVTYSGPKVDVIPPEEMLIDPEAKSLDEALFVIHRVKRTISYLREKEKEGVYSGIAEVIRHTSSDEALRNSEESTRYATAGDATMFSNTGEQEQIARRKVEVYEWWGLLDTKGDGIAEPYLVVVAGDTIIRMERNPYAHGLPPFIELRPILDLFRFHGIGIAELVGEFQQTKTALMRQMLDNLSFQNNQMWEVDENAGVDIQSLINPRPGGVVFTNFLGKGFREITPQPLGSAPLQMMEFIQTQLEQRSGVTRYNQGLDARSLNKLLALDTLVPLIDGTYKLNKDIVEGDIVVGSDGKGVRVLKAHPVQMPERAFEITFKSGDVIRAGGDHRWSVKVCDRHSRNMSPEWEKLPTERIYDLIQTGHKVFIPRVGPVDFTEKDLPIPPYLLGAWLGDGNAHTNRFTTMEPEIVEAFDSWAKTFYKGRVEECLHSNSGKAKTYQLVNTPFRKMLKDLGVLRDSRHEETRSNVKHIPDIYLQGSFDQRLALLRGLMDTDGCVDKKGNSIFCNSEPALVMGFALLVESLGGKPNVNWRKGVSRRFPNARPHAHVTFALEYCPVTLPAKAARWRTNPKYWEKQAIVKIREIPIEPMRCLTVDAEDELYVCGRRLTLTSNTATGISAIMNASAQRIELIAQIMSDSIRRLYKMMLELNQQFIDQEMVVRIFNEALEISPDDLAGNFDVQVDIGGATGKEETRVEQMLSILQHVTLLMQIGVMTPQNVHEAVKKIMELWGWKDYESYLTDPQEKEQLMAVMQQIAQLGQMVQAGQIPPIQQIVAVLQGTYHVLAAVTGAGLGGGVDGGGNSQGALSSGGGKGQSRASGPAVTGLLDPNARTGAGTGPMAGPAGYGGSPQG